MTDLRWRVALLALALVALGLYGREQRRRGAAEALAASAMHRADSLASVRARVDTVYAGERLVYAGWRERWDTARVAHLQRIVDSLRGAGIARPETVTVDVPVSVLVTADSTIQACSAVVLSCGESRRLLQAENLELRAAVAAQPKPPSALARWAERALYLGAGYGLGRLTAPR